MDAKKVKKIKRRGKRLYRCADRHVVHIEYAAQRNDFLREFNLRRKQMTPEVIAEAKRYDRKVSERIDRKVAAYNKEVERRKALRRKALGLPDITFPEKDEIPKGGRSTITKKRRKLFGFPMTAVIRWMGKENWKFEEASEVLGLHNVDVAPETIRAQLRAGRKGQRGAPANLTSAQVDELLGVLEL